MSGNLTNELLSLKHIGARLPYTPSCLYCLADPAKLASIISADVWGQSICGAASECWGKATVPRAGVILTPRLLHFVNLNRHGLCSRPAYFPAMGCCCLGGSCSSSADTWALGLNVLHLEVVEARQGG